MPGSLHRCDPARSDCYPSHTRCAPTRKGALGRLSRPIITGNGFIEPGVAWFVQIYGWRAVPSVSGAPGPRVEGARGRREVAGFFEGHGPGQRKRGHGTDRTREIPPVEPLGEVRSRGHQFGGRTGARRGGPREQEGLAGSPANGGGTVAARPCRNGRPDPRQCHLAQQDARLVSS